MNYQLGYASLSDNVDQPRKVYFQEENKYSDPTSIKDVTISKMKTIAISESGDVFTWGIENDGKIFHVLPEKVNVDFSRDIDRASVVLTQAEWSALERMSKGASRHYVRPKEGDEDSGWGSKTHKKSANMFELNPEYFLTRICVQKIACSNKHSLMVPYWC